MAVSVVTGREAAALRAVTNGTPLDRVEFVLFDGVGTILRPEPAVVDVYFAAGARYGSRRTPAEIRARFATALIRYRGWGVVPAWNGTPRRATHVVTPTDAAAERQRWWNIVGYVFDDVLHARPALFQDLWNHFGAGAHWRLYDDVAPTWQALRAAGYRLGLASNFDERLTGICHDIPLLREAERFVSSELGYPKPHERFYRTIERRLNRAGGQLLLVGDNFEHDVEAPRRLGWPAVFLDRERSSPHAALATLTELLPLLSIGPERPKHIGPGQSGAASAAKRRPGMAH